MRALAWVLVTVGCARQPMRIPTGRDLDAEMHEIRATRTEGVPEEVTEFRGAVRRLADDTDPRHEQTVQALRLMARAARRLPSPSGDEHAQRIEMQAAALEHSHQNAVHSDFTRRALMEATRALDESRSRLAGWPERLGAARSSVEAIDPTIPYLEERQVIDRAFYDVANAFVVATAASRGAASRALGERTMTLTVHRWAGDRRGESPNFQAVCGGPASMIVLDRTPLDVTAAVFTFGWYTPVHVRVTCPYGDTLVGSK